MSSEPLLATTRPVLVTGATGFVAGHTIQQLLQKGYSVRCTVRDVKKKEKYAYLMELEGSDRIEFFAADLNDKDSFKPAFEGGIECVLHIASPYVVTVEDPQRDLVDPAVNGTLAILELCKEYSTVKRVIVTSSVAAVTDCPDSSKIYTEEDWNTESSLTRNPYYFSKAQAERAANKFMDEQKPGFSLAFVLPGAVIGPALGSGINESHGLLLQFMTGESPVAIDVVLSFCDVRDIAAAHIVLMENPSATGRYLCAGTTLPLMEILQYIKASFPELAGKIPSRSPPNWIVKHYTRLAKDSGSADFVEFNVGRVHNYNSERGAALGIPNRPWRDTVCNTVEFFKRVRAVPIQWTHQSKCSLCDTSYGIFTREHHCRSCCKSVCSSCSPSKKQMQSIGGKWADEKVCKNCV